MVQMSRLGQTVKGSRKVPSHWSPSMPHIARVFYLLSTHFKGFSTFSLDSYIQGPYCGSSQGQFKSRGEIVFIEHLLCNRHVLKGLQKGYRLIIM